MAMNTTAVHYDGPVPDSVVEDLSKGAIRYEKRIVKSMAAESRIVDGMNIRPFDDFKHDWRYDRSVYGTTDTCGVCGKHPIKENCVLVDDHTGQELIVGNTCVHRYIEIELDGVRLTGEKKKVFLKEKMSKAKKVWKTNEWNRQYPRAQEYLDHYEDWMTETRVTWPKRPVNPALNTLHRAMTKRLSKHGFPGPKLWSEWEDFLKPRTGPDADKRHAIWVIAKRDEERAAEVRRLKEEDRKARFAANAAATRAQWKKEADEWCGNMRTRDLGFNSWELNMIDRVRQAWTLGGRPLGDNGMTRFMAEAETKLAIRDGTVALTGEALEASALLKNPKLTGWERGFLTSIMVRLHSGHTLSDKQRYIYNGMKEKHGA